MFKQSFNLKLGKAVCGSVRNTNSYYVVLLNNDRSIKWISRNMRND